MAVRRRFAQHYFVDSAYGLGHGKRFTLGALEKLCAEARAGGAGSGAVVATQAAADGSPSLRITWSD